MLLLVLLLLPLLLLHGDGCTGGQHITLLHTSCSPTGRPSLCLPGGMDDTHSLLPVSY